MSQEGKKDIQEIQNGIIQECSIVSKCFFRLSKFFEQLGILNKEKNNNNPLIENNNNLENLGSNYISNNNSENLNSEDNNIPKKKIKENKTEENNKSENEEVVSNSNINRPKKQKENKYLKKTKDSQQKNISDKNEKKINEDSHSNLRKKRKLINHNQKKKNKKDKPLKDIGYGRVLPVICYKGDIKIHGYKVQVKYYNSFYSLGPFEDYKFSYELKLYLLNELSNFHCTKENYEKVIENVFKEIEASIYEEHPKLSQKPKDENKNIGNVENKV